MYNHVLFHVYYKCNKFNLSRLNHDFWWHLSICMQRIFCFHRVPKKKNSAATSEPLCASVAELLECWSQKLFEPAHQIMALSVLHTLILQTCMRSHPVGLDVWFLVRYFIYFHMACVQTAKALVRLRGCAGSPEPSLVAYVWSTIILWVGSIFMINLHDSYESGLRLELATPGFAVRLAANCTTEPNLHKYKANLLTWP